MQKVVEILTNASFVVILYFITRVAGTEIATIGVGTILVASTDVPCAFINVYNYSKMNECYIVNDTQSHALSLYLTNVSSVIILNLITRVAGTEIATIGVGTILVASTDVPCTLINVFIYMNNERSISGIVCIKHANSS